MLEIVSGNDILELGAECPINVRRVVPMRRKSTIRGVAAVLMTVCICVAVCAATQAAERYAMEQEKKNILIKGVEENVDVLRACLPPYSRMSQGGTPLSINPREVSDLVNSSGSEHKQ